MRPLISAAALFLAVCVVRADDWPMLGGHPDRNAVSSEKNLPTVWSWENPKKKTPRKNIKWVAELGGQTWGNPVVSGGRIFVGTNNENPRDPAVKGDRGVLMCLSAADGSFLWQAVHEKLHPNDQAKAWDEDVPHVGLTSTACVSGNRVYYVSNRAELVCRAVEDGRQIWLLDMRKELGAKPCQASPCSPLVADNLVFVLTGNSAQGIPRRVENPSAPSFIAVHAETGKVAWQDASPGNRILEMQWGSPSYGVVEGQAQVLFPGGDGWLYSFEPRTGKLLWKFNCIAHLKVGADGKLEDQNTLFAAPVVVGHRVLISLGWDTETSSPPGCLWAIDARKRGDITKEGALWSVTRAARPKKDEEFGRSLASVAVQDGLVYAVEQQGYVNCIELESGRPIWSYDMLTTVWGGPTVADGKVYVHTIGEETFVFQTGREAKLLAKNLSWDMSFGIVAVSGGVLYFAGGDGGRKLYAVANDQ